MRVGQVTGDSSDAELLSMDTLDLMYAPRLRESLG